MISGFVFDGDRRVFICGGCSSSISGFDRSEAEDSGQKVDGFCGGSTASNDGIRLGFEGLGIEDGG